LLPFREAPLRGMKAKVKYHIPLRGMKANVKYHKGRGDLGPFRVMQRSPHSRKTILR